MEQRMKILKYSLVLTAMAAALSPFNAMAQEATPKAMKPVADPMLESQKWFQDNKFGIFLHWGIYSELGGVGQRGVAEWIMEEAKIPANKYERLAQFFNPTGFDADEWVKGFHDAGAKYIVITSKHHDGFAMFDSKVSPYNIVAATPFKRDPMKELAAACKKYGIKLFFYYSQLDWHNPDYFPRGRTGHAAGRPQQGDWDKYIDYQNAQLTELLTQYGPIGGIWFDGWWDQEETAYRDRWRLKETYDLIHRLQPGAMIVNNHHVAPFPGENYQAFEQDLPGENSAGFNKAEVAAIPLESANTMNGSWGFNLTDTNFRTTKSLIRSLVGAAGRNANLLLNTGPMPNGKVQPENLATLAEMGTWLKIYGDSIYGTRGGPVLPRPWGVTTAKGKFVYVHILDWKDANLVVPIGSAIKSAVLLKDGSPVAIKRVDGGVDLTVPAAGVGDFDRVIRLELAGK
jgi:alpha-L-fucosidase